MPAYQNYYPGMMYQPNYAMPPQVQTATVPGKIVNDFNEVMANDVPLDGRVAVFMKNDYSEMQARSWQPDGTIRTVRFTAAIPQAKNEPQVEQKTPEMANFDVLNGIAEQIATLNEKIDRLSKPAKVKKEVADEQ